MIQRSTLSAFLPEAGLFAGRTHRVLFPASGNGPMLFSSFILAWVLVYHKFSKKKTLFSKKCGKRGKILSGKEEHISRGAVGIGDLAAHALQTEVSACVLPDHMIPKAHGGKVLRVTL